MAKIEIDKQRCKGCLLCVSFCPKGSIGKDKELNQLGYLPAKFVNLDKCIGCAVCAIICPDCCIEVFK